ncbi:hypothetical protein IHQ72_25460 [Mesorhizobium onobrychidis]|uniref:Uncharacterized protein n=1 Tax=Mesorhizobium onobrychidis TaxID=2775404 RepID=A0ABY5QV96_9HYPH|nr:hypothetical protein [Mesorhizobium onobrychidis]UVC14007.1 hypothetical protein IHQ72_25460 [Mesorhizobium onobrychidis]
MWLGSLAYAPQWSALALAIGAGAILQVIVEVGAYLMRRSQKGLDAFLHAAGRAWGWEPASPSYMRRPPW